MSSSDSSPSPRKSLNKLSLNSSTRNSPPSPSPRNGKSGVSDDKLEKLLNEWSKVKHQISQLDQREKDIKELITDIMSEEKTTTLFTDNYKVTKKTQRRSHLSQKDVPEDVWKKYSKTTEFSVFYLKRV